MFVNEAKGWYGSLSKIGRDAAIHAFSKLAGYKKEHNRNYSSDKKVPKMDKDNLDHFKDNLIIIKTYHNTISNTNSKPIKKPKKGNNKKKEEKLQFHKFFHPQITEIEESRYVNSPSCTKYTPKYSLVFPKLLTGPKWKIMEGRKYKKVEIDEKDFLITHESKIDSGYKYLVNMNRTTKRGNIFGNKDVRVRSDKRFDSIKISKNKKSKSKSKSKDKNCKTVGNEKSKKTKSKPKIRKKNNSEDKLLNKRKKNKKKTFNININNIHRFNIKREHLSNTNINTSFFINKAMIKKSKSHVIKLKKSFFKNYQKLIEDKINQQKKEYENDISQKMKNNTINFDKIISREKANKLYSKDRYLDVARSINYSLVEERPKTFIFNNSTKNSSIIKKFKGVEPTINFDANKAHNIFNVHALDKVPNFDLILPRPGEKRNPLPSFMQNIFSREANYSVTDKSLKLNLYSKGKLGKVESSFFPKQSYNNIVNIQIMAGSTFENEYNIDDINSKKDKIKKNMKFKYKSLGKLIKEGALTRFDNITFKTIHKNKNYTNSDLNKFLFGLKE